MKLPDYLVQKLFEMTSTLPWVVISKFRILGWVIPALVLSLSSQVYSSEIHERMSNANNPISVQDVAERGRGVHTILQLPESLPFLDIYLDLDNTLVYLKSRSKLKPSAGASLIPDRNPENYGLVHGCLEFLEYLARIDGIRLHFFSAGVEERNIPLVAHIMSQVELRTGHSIPYDVFSKKDMTESFKIKDLRKVGANLRTSVLIDDSPRAIRCDQDSNWISVFPGYDFLASSETDQILDERSKVISRHIDRHFFFRQQPVTNLNQAIRNNLVRTLGILIKLVEKIENSPSTRADIRPALEEIQHARRNARVGAKNDQYLTKLGLEAIQQIHPDFELWEACSEMPL